ncbi:Hypothetical protein, putative [Bodo saltans]|uniref:Uncharacterized protein n=1 Tax=Bodo saltans TaxID=75058 RepID=A0A0S4J0I5_BODSA|nr:Hypothetical protein, putative [Bodo saltans]|eukprot:CUG34870.1 Hypothetical protein, putative [Bodo saltans]
MQRPRQSFVSHNSQITNTLSVSSTLRTNSTSTSMPRRVASLVPSLSIGPSSRGVSSNPLMASSQQSRNVAGVSARHGGGTAASIPRLFTTPTSNDRTPYSARSCRSTPNNHHNYLSSSSLLQPSQSSSYVNNSSRTQQQQQQYTQHSSSGAATTAHVVPTSPQDRQQHQTSSRLHSMVLGRSSGVLAAEKADDARVNVPVQHANYQDDNAVGPQWVRSMSCRLESLHGHLVEAEYLTNKDVEIIKERQEQLNRDLMEVVTECRRLVNELVEQKHSNLSMIRDAAARQRQKVLYQSGLAGAAHPQPKFAKKEMVHCVKRTGNNTMVLPPSQCPASVAHPAAASVYQPPKRLLVAVSSARPPVAAPVSHLYASRMINCYSSQMPAMQPSDDEIDAADNLFDIF